MAWIEKDTPVCSLKDRKEEKKGREGRKEGRMGRLVHLRASGKEYSPDNTVTLARVL